MITYKNKTYDAPPTMGHSWLVDNSGWEEESRQASIRMVEGVVIDRLFAVLLLRRKYLKKRQRLEAAGASQKELDNFHYVLKDDHRKRYIDRLLNDLREGNLAWLGPEYVPRQKE